MDAPAAEPRLRFSLRDLFALTAMVCMALALIVPAIVAAREASRRSQCANNLKNLALGFHNYHDVWKSLPPSRYVANDGALLHSWRTLLYAVLDQSPFSTIYRPEEPWNSGVNNRLVIGTPVTYFDYHSGKNVSLVWQFGHGHCPSSTKWKDGLTNYVVTNGHGTIFPADNVSLKFADIADGISNTLLVGEMDPPTIHWLEPRDLEFPKLPLQINSRTRPCLSSGHPNGLNVAMADGATRFLENSTPAAKLRSYLIINDGPKSQEEDEGE